MIRSCHSLSDFQKIGLLKRVTMDTGQRIKDLRNEINYMQQGLADAVELTLNEIGKIEAGLRVPSIDAYVRISEFFGVTIDYLVLER